MKLQIIVGLCMFFIFQAPAFSQETRKTRDSHVIIPVNDLGMHCMDLEYSVFSLLPPFNVLNAQIVYRNPSGYPDLLDDQSAVLLYGPAQDPSGSFNSTSLLKTDFWVHAQSLFGIPLLPGQGLLGFYMPDDAPIPGPQPLHYEAAHAWFSAPGIPITPMDNAGQVNPYPLLNVAGTVNGQTVRGIDTVVPVSSETSCSNCHATPTPLKRDYPYHWNPSTGKVVPPPTGLNLNQEKRTKRNILALHDQHQGTNLLANQPVLCAECHYSTALDLSGAGPQGPQLVNPNMSETMHAYHGSLLDDQGQPVFPPNGSVNDTCYQCHPGEITQCLRGPMAAGGMTCKECHGDMLSVGGEYPLLAGGSMDGTNDGQPRRPWIDLPRCQSCHTGDELNHLSGPQYMTAADGLRLFQAHRLNDPSASPILAQNKRFAENDDTSYRLSKGHGGLMCQACHGSTHAEWPNADANANDNLTAIQLQGHSGPIIECATCHSPGTLPMTVNGPHGMHNVNHPEWTDHEHEDFFKQNENSCRACHGLDLQGSPLGRAAADRLLIYDEGEKQIFIAKGQEIRCNLCHGIPD